MPTDCRLYLAEVILEDEVLVELEGETSGWVAVGYSEDRLMGGDNIDDVIGCLVTGSGHTVVAKDTYNIPNLLNNRDDLVRGVDLVPCYHTGPVPPSSTGDGEERGLKGFHYKI